VTLLSAQRNAAYLASLAGMLAIFVSGELPLPLTLVAAIAFVGSYFAGERLAGRGQWLWRIALVGGFFFLAAQVVVFNTFDLILAASIFAILILTYSLYNRETTKDYSRVHLGALLCISGGAALSADLAFGASFLIFAVATTWSLTLTQLRLEIEDEAKANQVADGGASILNSRRFASVRFLAVLAGLALTALVGAFIIFLTFPRVSFGMLQRASTAGGSKTGFANQVQLGAPGRLKDDPTVAFRVTVRAGPTKGSSLGLYWRGATLDVYDGKTWSDASLAARRIKRDADFTYQFRRPRGTDEFIVELPGDLTAETIFTTGRLTAIQMLPRPGGVRTIEPPSLWVDGAGDITFRPPQSQPFSYVVATNLQREPNLRGLGRDYEEGFRQHFTVLPKLDPRVEKLGKQLAEGKDPLEATRAVERYLANIRYTTEMLASGDDPLASFLFDVKAGHCEYFATAMTVLLRVGGIPARVVTGYYGGRYVERGNYYAVRQGDAHAWVEVWFPQEGWVTFDATPVSSREATDSLASQLELWMDGVRTAWRVNVVDFNLASQMRSLQQLSRIANTVNERLTGGSKSKKFDAAKVRQVLSGVVLLVVFAGGAVWLWRRYGRRRAKSTESRTEAQRRARLLYVDLLKRLEPHGIAKRASQTPREVAAEVRARALPSAPLVERVVERYLASRFGDAPLEAEELKALRRELKEL
jgi:transglutaminase-like putative cysteine protease